MTSHSAVEMGLFEHLAELRAVLLQSLAAVLVLSVVAWFFSERAVDLLIRPAAEPAGGLKFISPTGAFLLRFKTAVGLGAFAAAPVVMWRLWSFVVPGLLRRERRALLPVVFSSIVLFYLGAAFAYEVILPVSLRFLVGFGTDLLQPMITAEHYFDFAVRITLAFGLVFQLPLVTTLLTMWGLLPPDFLQRYWRYGVVLVFVASALLTPPDLASQLLMAGPVLLLYFLSMGLARMVGRRRASGEDPDDDGSPPPVSGQRST